LSGRSCQIRCLGCMAGGTWLRSQGSYARPWRKPPQDPPARALARGMAESIVTAASQVTGLTKRCCASWQPSPVCRKRCAGCGLPNTPLRSRMPESRFLPRCVFWGVFVCFFCLFVCLFWVPCFKFVFVSPIFLGIFSLCFVAVRVSPFCMAAFMTV
jgi:hypothetical protein